MRKWWQGDIGQCFYSSASVEKQEFQTDRWIILNYVPCSHFCALARQFPSLILISTTSCILTTKIIILQHEPFAAASFFLAYALLHPKRPVGQIKVWCSHTCRPGNCCQDTVEHSERVIAVWVSEQEVGWGTVHN